MNEAPENKEMSTFQERELLTIMITARKTSKTNKQNPQKPTPTLKKDIASKRTQCGIMTEKIPSYCHCCVL